MGGIRVVGYAVLFAGVLIIAAGIHFWSWSHATLAHNETFTFELRPGQGLYHVAETLEAYDAIPSSLYLRALGRLTGDAEWLQAGEYRVEPNATPRSLLRQLRYGEVILHDVVIIAGTTVSQLLTQLNNNALLTSSAVALDRENLAFELGLAVPFVEGYFLPETYFVRRGEDVLSVLSRAHDLMQSALEIHWQDRAQALPIASAHELLIMASLIEKETGMAAERGQISQVFHRRLTLGMRLQTDPTVIYALGDEFDGDIRRRDLRVDSPFNTYRYAGLPPTPIALPSRESLHAAAHPAAGEFLYFVARGDGSSQFSQTLEEHNKAVRKYQLGQAQ